MSKYHDLKNKITIDIKDENEYKKSSITKLIEAYYKKGEKIPDIVLENINFTNGVFCEYALMLNNNYINIKKQETIAQNMIDTLPIEMYEKYIDITWLKTYEQEDNQFMYSLIYHKKFDVINKFLDLISKESHKDNFTREVFEPIFHLEHNIRNFLDNNNINAIKEYYNTFQKALKTYQPFYDQKCANYKSETKELEKWHKEYEYIYEVNNKNKLHNVQLYLLKNDEFLDILKSIFNQYDNAHKNTYLSKEYMEEAVKNGQEKIVTYYISELLKHNEATPEQIEESIVKGLNEKIFTMYAYINSSFNDESRNDYKNTYQLKEIYEITEKYGSYKPNYNILSKMVLIDDNDFQQNFVKKIIPEEKLLLHKLNINQWKHIGIIIEQIKQLTGKGFKQSRKQIKGNIKKENQEFVDNNAFEFIYIINQINKLYPGKPEPISEKKLDQVYEYMKSVVNEKMIDSTFDLDKFRLNNKLNAKLEEKVKVKQPKI